MSAESNAKNHESDSHDQTARRWDTFGGPDPGGPEDVLSPPGEPERPAAHDILGGPDAPGPEDEITPPGEPERPAAHEILGGPDAPGREDILGPPGEE